MLFVLTIFIPPVIAAEGDEYVCCGWTYSGGSYPNSYTGVAFNTNKKNTCADNPPSKPSDVTWIFTSQQAGYVSNTIFGEEKYMPGSSTKGVIGCVFPPSCPHDISKSPSSYCRCEVDGSNKVYSSVDGGICESAQEIECNSNYCGDWTILSQPPSGNDNAEEKGRLNRIGIKTFFGGKISTQDDQYGIGPTTHITYLYYNNSPIDLKMKVNCDDDVWVHVHKVPDNLDTTNLFIDESTEMFSSGSSLLCTWGSDGGQKIEALSTLTSGWYAIEFAHFDYDRSEQLQAVFLDENDQEQVLTDLFKGINSYGPILIDGDESSELCTIRNGAWSDNSDITFDRRCCGDDFKEWPEGDTGYIDPVNKKQCMFDGTGWVWGEISSTCGDNGEGQFLSELLSNPYYDPLAYDGGDACCGDDGFASCVVGDTFFNRPACEYNEQTECDNDRWCKWNSTSNSCDKRASEEFCAQLSYDDCLNEGCEWDPGDYGYVDSNNVYLCYNHYSDLASGEDNSWEWISADNSEKSFIIEQFNFTQRFSPPPRSVDLYTDYVSNSEKWFYCNANTDAPVGAGGTPILEYGTFDSVINFQGPMFCSDFMTLITGGITYETCESGQAISCCNDYSQITLNDRSTYKNCDDECFDGDGSEIVICVIAPAFCESDGGGGIYGEEYIEKSLCLNPAKCMDASLFDSGESCEDQVPSGEKCADDQVCGYGRILIKDSAGEDCCYGELPEDPITSNCIDTANAECAAIGGYIYNPETQECPLGYDSFKDITGVDCCMTTPVIKSSSYLSLFSGVLNSSYICYKENGNNYMASCCYGTDCKNADTKSSQDVLLVNYQRVYGTGSSFHTVLDFDKYVGGVLKDYFKKKGQSEKGTITTSLHDFNNMSGFDFIEFNIAFNNEGALGHIYINDIDYGLLKNYLSNGDAPLRWHHVIIPINDLQKGDLLDKLEIENLIDDSEFIIFIDNILFSTAAENDLNSNNYYCSGGFATWLSDLEPNLTINPYTDDTFYELPNGWENIGPYSFACDSQGPFKWSGHQCCGDDTKLSNYGEFYNDTTAGCFNGTYLLDDWTMSYAYNVPEPFSDDFEEYKYKDLIYNKTYFVGCQVNLDKYSGIKISYSGDLNEYPNTNQNIDNILLDNNIVDEQCVVVGTHYCFDQAWRQYVPGINAYNLSTESYTPSIPSTLSLKSIPPAAELIKNGNFGGECVNCNPKNEQK